MLYKVIEEHKARSISSGIYTIKVGKEIDGTDHFELFCLNKKKCYDETQETLNIWCDMIATDY